MIAADTNVWIRYVTNDDPVQARRALALLENASRVFLPKTVLLEVEWVLRAVYELPRDSVRGALLHVLGLEKVIPEEAEQVAAAIDLYEKGLDFADALHLASAGKGTLFHSFDAALVKGARAAGVDAAAVP
jgi:predicted nucleic-acid-binding protein